LFIKYQPVAVHLQSKDDFIAGTFAARVLGIKVLWSDYADLKHIFMNHKIWYKNPIGKMVYFAAHFTNKIIVVSKEDLRLISLHIPNGPVRNKMTVIYNGSFDSYKKISKNKEFTFISSSRIVTDKGIAELINAFNQLNKIHPDTKLHILGDGPEREFFENKAKSNSAITFFGHQPNPLDYVSKAHVFIIPTYHEGFSIALVEACMLGMPIIATDVGGNPEIIQHNKTGLLVKVKDSGDLFKAMKTLYTNEDLRLLIGKNARHEYTDKFNFDTIIKEQFIPLYESVDQ
jgi:glycosyltransferase involved in cell wall biosynthesis